MKPRQAQFLTHEGVAGIGNISLVADVLHQEMGRRPHFGGAIRIGGQSDLERLRRAAAEVLFQADPAPRPNPGHFTLNLASDSNVLLKIWAGDNESGPIVFDRLFQNIPMGSNPIPWDLHNKSHNVVKAGEYLATLESTPIQRGRSDTLFFASFEVI